MYGRGAGETVGMVHANNQTRGEQFVNEAFDDGEVGQRSKDANDSQAPTTAVQEPSMPEETTDFTRWYMKLSWLLFNATISFSVVVTVVYFGALYPMLAAKGYTPGVMDINLHAINSLMVILELLLSAFPVRLLHVVYPFIYGVTYVVFSVFFWMGDPKNNVVYPILDWNEPATAGVVVVVLGLVVLPLFHSMAFGIYRLRLLVYRKVYNHEYC